ncbi:F-box protein At1g49360-like [Humulus lupulus]|uniref:F-box protein At1g49360-like n=1 Tax=Humulus lupulus TaxID=3486 RepID=UPI002B40DAFA|nr:F-box protein At1g49360-like [Humulus lupulus]
MEPRRKKNRKQKQQKRHYNGNNSKLISVNVNWAELPRVVLEIIFEGLSVVDCISVSNVCKPWRNVFSPDVSCWKGSGIPSLIMSGQHRREKRTCISMMEKRAWEMELPEAHKKYCWGSFQDWLILVDDSVYLSVEISLLNPFTRSTINLPRTWDDYHKIVLSGLPYQKNFVCMLLHNERREIAFWVPGAQSWNKFKLVGEPFEDAIFYNGSFYLLSKDDEVCQLDAASIFAAISGDNALADASADSSVPEIKIQSHKVSIVSENPTNDNVMRYLVESRGELLLVCRFFSTSPGAILETRKFEVYVLDIGEMSWKKVEHLRDRVLFLGKCCSRSFSVKELGVPMTNRIYFSNDNVAPWWNEWDSGYLQGMSSRMRLDNSGRKHWGIFWLGNKDNHNFCFRGDRDNWGPIWFTAPLWWYCNNFLTY